MPVDDDRPPSWYWWVVNVYQPQYHDLKVDLEQIVEAHQAATTRMERMLWGVMIGLVGTMGGIIAVLIR